MTDSLPKRRSWRAAPAARVAAGHAPRTSGLPLTAFTSVASLASEPALLPDAGVAPVAFAPVAFAPISLAREPPLLANARVGAVPVGPVAFAAFAPVPVRTGPPLPLRGSAVPFRGQTACRW
jgi:hypothetical protein